MKINEECIRDVLIYLVANLKINIKENSFGGLSKINLKIIIDKLNEKYSSEDIWYSIYNIYQADFIEGTGLSSMQKPSNTHFIDVEISNVTYKGHRFIEAIRPESVWEKTKNVVGKVGNHTLGFIEDTAQKVAIESAKHMINMSMGKIE